MDTSSYSINSSPTTYRQGYFPSPTHSLSSTSSGNDTSLCTPENQIQSLPGHDLKREMDIHAANARYLSATKKEQQSLLAKQELKEGSNMTLAAALEFENASEQKPAPTSTAMTNTPSTLGKRLGHTRNNSSISRRHSIQPQMPTSLSDQEEAQRRLFQGLDPSASPFGVKKEISSFEDDLQLWQSETEHLNFDLAMSTLQSSDFLLSPPQLTVNLAAQQLQEKKKKEGESEESKRRRTALTVLETPQRPMSAQTIMQHTPPNHWTQMQAQASSIQSSATSSRISQTPLSMTSSMTNSSIFESGGSHHASSLRRRSSIQGDCISQLASLTAGITTPSPMVQENNNKKPMSAKMEYSSSQPVLPKSSSSTLERSDSKAEKTKSPDVWPDDVEVAFWEGKLIHFNEIF